MIAFRNFSVLLGVFLALLLHLATASEADTPLTWTMLQPENDSRNSDVRDFDDFQSSHLVAELNSNEKIFLGRLVWRKTTIKTLLSTHAPFTELRFDAMKPLILTEEEKAILREYLTRGGFILLVEDAYPYAAEDRWIVTSWAIIDFITKELPIADSNFRVEKVGDNHPLFHQYFDTKIDPVIQRELDFNPRLPYRTLLSYRGHPAAFVVGRFYQDQGRLIAEPKPYPKVFSVSRRGYQLLTNLYVYAALN